MSEPSQEHEPSFLRRTEEWPHWPIPQTPLAELTAPVTLSRDAVRINPAHHSHRYEVGVEHIPLEESQGEWWLRPHHCFICKRRVPAWWWLYYWGVPVVSCADCAAILDLIYRTQVRGPLAVMQWTCVTARLLRRPWVLLRQRIQDDLLLTALKSLAGAQESWWRHSCRQAELDQRAHCILRALLMGAGGRSRTATLPARLPPPE